MYNPIAGGTPSRIQYVQTAPGTQRGFTYPFQILAAADLAVAIDDTILDPAAYHVSGEGNTHGGDVTLEAAPAVGTRITLWRAMPIVRDNTFVAGTEIRASTLNDAFDRMTLIIRQVADGADRAVRPAVSDTDRDLTLPSVPERAGRYLSFDAEGRPETVTARFLGDIQNFGLIYLGAHPGSQPPGFRLNGTPLRIGDLYFDTESGRMNIRRADGWSIAANADPSLLRHDGSLAMSGDLDLAGHDLVNPGLIDGRNVAQDGATLDALNDVIEAWEFTSRYIATRNAWEIAQLRGLTVHALANTYLDTFDDLSGIELGQVPISGNAGTVIIGTDGTMQVSPGLWGPELAFDGAPAATGVQAVGNPSYLYVGKDWGEGQARTVTKVRVWGEATDRGFAQHAAACALRFQGSQTGTWSGEETTLWSAPDFQDTGGAFVEFSVPDTGTAYRYHRLLVEETEAAGDLQIMEIDLFEGEDHALSSVGLRHDTESGSIANGQGPTIDLSTEAQWLSRPGFDHLGATVSIAANAGAIRRKLPFVGNFDLDISIGAVDAQKVWRVGLFERDEIGNFDPTLALGGLPTGAAAAGIENGLAVSISQDTVQVHQVADNSVSDAGSADVVLAGGDTVTLCRRDHALTVKVGGERILTIVLPQNADYFPVLGSAAQDCEIGNLSWSQLHDGPMVLVSRAVSSDGSPDDMHVLVECEGVFRGENALTHSNDFQAAAWNRSGVTVQEMFDPSIARTVFRMEETNVAGVHSLIRIVPITPGRTYTASLFAKAAERTKLRLLWGNQSTSRYGYAIYDLAAGTVSQPVTINTSSPFSATITSTANGWYRCAITGLLDAESDQGQFNLLLLNSSGATNYLGTAGLGINLQGAQLESSEVLGPYFETVDMSTEPRVVLERDVTVELSRDNGGTWWDASLAAPPEQAFGYMLAHYFADLSGQSHGSDIRIRLSMDRPEPVRFTRWAVQAEHPLSVLG